MRFPLVILLGLVALGLAPSLVSAQGAIEGRVELRKSSGAPVMTKRYEVVTKGGALKTNPPLAVVYVEGVRAGGATPVPQQVIQKDLMFSPGLLPVQVGTRVEFPNLDDTYHNIFSYSPAKRFDLGRYRKEDPIPSLTFDKPGLVTLRCDIHEHMRGLILVLETPYFVATGEDGRYRLTGLPPGRHTVKAWIDSKTTHERTVEVKNGATVQVDFP
jgi:plastocyanin